MHLWDLPAGDGAFVLTGSAAARATFLDRAGAPLADIEAVPGDGLRLRRPGRRPTGSPSAASASPRRA